jgi:hypothetical protein
VTTDVWGNLNVFSNMSGTEGWVYNLTYYTISTPNFTIKSENFSVAVVCGHNPIIAFKDVL